MALDPARVVSQLRELQELTGDDERRPAGRVDGDLEHRASVARRAPRRAPARAASATPRATTGGRCRGESERAVLIGGHIDSVPNGGWLDGCLNVVAGAEVLRRIAEQGTPPVTVRLVNWADEEGARFGRSLFGSSAAAGSMSDQDELRLLRRRATASRSRTRSPRTASTSTARSTRAPSSRRAAAYLELHIEQGPVLESMGIPLGAVLGTYRRRALADHLDRPGGARRLDADGQAPRRARRGGEAGARDPRDRGARRGRRRVHVGRRRLPPGDRHLRRRDRRAAARPAPSRRRRAWRSCCARRREASERFAAEEDLEVDWERIWSIEPILFDPALIDLCDEACRERRRHLAPAAVGPAARRRRGRARGRPDGDAVRPEPARPVPHEARGHAGGASRARRRCARPAGRRHDRAGHGTDRVGHAHERDPRIAREWRSQRRATLSGTGHVAGDGRFAGAGLRRSG